MAVGTRVKMLLATVLIGAALVGPPHELMRSPETFWKVGFLTFGLFNALVEVSGTRLVRVGAVLLSTAALLLGTTGSWPMILLVWFIWPPAYMASWALTRESRARQGTSPVEDESSAQRARAAVASIIAAVAAASFLYRLLVRHDLQQTAALFIGIPSLIAVLVVLGASPRSATGVACKAVAVGLLVSMLFLEEGILCVVMAAPLFFLVAIAISSAMQALDDRNGTSSYSFAVLLLVVPMSLEGVTRFTTVDRAESVSETRIIDVPAAAVERALVGQPRFERRLPLYLRAGFPMAVATRIERRADETRWVIRVRGGEMRLNGMEPREGDLVLALEESRPGLVRWRAVSDSSHMTHFLSWREILVRWQPVTPTTTRVSWTLDYDRGLDPAWYFGPMERYAVRLAAGYLIDTVATP